MLQIFVKIGFYEEFDSEMSGLVFRDFSIGTCISGLEYRDFRIGTCNSGLVYRGLLFRGLALHVIKWRSI